MHDGNSHCPEPSLRQLAAVEERSIPKQRAQRGDAPVARVRQRRFHPSQAARHLPVVNGRAWSGMHAALAQDSFEGLPEGAAGPLGGSKEISNPDRGNSIEVWETIVLST